MHLHPALHIKRMVRGGGVHNVSPQRHIVQRADLQRDQPLPRGRSKGAGDDVVHDGVDALDADAHGLPGEAMHEVALDPGFMLIVVAADALCQMGRGAVMHMVGTDDVPATGARDIDAVAVAEDLHHIVDLVVGDHIAA